MLLQSLTFYGHTRTFSAKFLRVFCPLLFLTALTLPLLADIPSAREGSREIFRWRLFLAPFHAVVLHFPIGFLTTTFILEIYVRFRASDDVRRVCVLMLWLSFISGIIAATFGLLRAGTGSYEASAMQLHRLFGFAVLAFTLIALGAQRFAYGTKMRRCGIFVYRTLLTVTLILLIVAGHLGGNLTHGSQYLVKNAPAFVRALLASEPQTDPALNNVALGERERFYVEKVQPILSAKCYGCHGPKKQKGGYRLDAPEIALRGGDSGRVAIQPGDPMASQLARLILLPPEHDDAMPPEGKQPLELTEMAILLEWIRAGAIFPDSQQHVTALSKARHPEFDTPVRGNNRNFR